MCSPATVSRNSIINLTEYTIEWTDLYAHFVKNSPAKDRKELQESQESLQRIVEFMKTASTVVPLNSNQLTRSFLRLLEAQLREGTTLVKSLAYAAIWSFGGSLTSEAKINFDSFFRNLPLGKRADFPSSEYVFNLALTRHMGSDRWTSWEDLPNLESNQLVKSSEIAGQLHLMSLYAANSIPFILAGPTAIGKTSSAQALLSRLSSSMQTSQLSIKKDTSRADIRNIINNARSEGQKGLVFLDNFNLLQK